MEISRARGSGRLIGSPVMRELRSQRLVLPGGAAA